MPKTSRTWKGARSPSGLKRVRQTKRRNAVLQPRRSEAKSLVAKALRAATSSIAGADPKAVLLDALSALDRAAKSGAIHANAAARRKSRLTKRLNAAMGGGTQATSHAVKSTSRAQAAKAARARIAAAKADKSKGTQTAAEKARAALTRTTRAETPAAAPAAPPRSRTTAKSGATKSAATKSTAKSSTSKSTATRKPASRAKTTSTKTSARKPSKG